MNFQKAIHLTVLGYTTWYTVEDKFLRYTCCSLKFYLAQVTTCALLYKVSSLDCYVLKAEVIFKQLFIKLSQTKNPTEKFTLLTVGNYYKNSLN